MAKITLSNGSFVLVDDSDFDYLNQWKWHEWSTSYAIRRVGNPGKLIWMHREINKTPKGFQTDHINRNRLDNRRVNLRTVSRSENIINSKLRSDNTTGHKGVYREKGKKTWMACICKDGKLIKLGRFRYLEDAVMMRGSAENQLFNL